MKKNSNQNVININQDPKPIVSNNNFILNLGDLMNNNNNKQKENGHNNLDSMSELEKEYCALKEEYNKLKEIKALGKEDENAKKYRKKVKKKLRALKSQRIQTLNDKNEIMSQKSKSD